MAKYERVRSTESKPNCAGKLTLPVRATAAIPKIDAKPIFLSAIPIVSNAPYSISLGNAPADCQPSVLPVGRQAPALEWYSQQTFGRGLLTVYNPQSRIDHWIIKGLGAQPPTTLSAPPVCCC